MIPVALTIAGSDSGGGAGIQADLKTFHAFGVFGTTAVTAITVQNTRGVRAVHPVPSDIVRGQIDAVAEDLRPAAFKTGMLATAELVRTVAEGIEANALPHFVLDPVMVATSGDRLLEGEAERAVIEYLVPRADLVTPNLHEAEILAGFPVDTESAMAEAAAVLLDRGAGAVLVKGGHLPGDEVVDLLVTPTASRAWRRPRIASTGGHGTGCTLAAAVASGLAHGRPLESAVGDALDFVARALREAPGLGQGEGPLSHFVSAR